MVTQMYKDVQRCAMALKETSSNDEPCVGAGQIYVELLPGHVSPVSLNKL